MKSGKGHVADLPKVPAVPQDGGGGKRYFDREYDEVASSSDILKLPSRLADSELTP